MVLMLEQVQDPGNVGAIVRAAEACGATGVVVGAGSADPFGWKALRGSMGSAFRLPVAVGSRCRSASSARAQLGMQHPRGRAARRHSPAALRPARGLSRWCSAAKARESPADLLALADEPPHHPDAAPVDSLNVATAAALIAYEAQRASAPERRRS